MRLKNSEKSVLLTVNFHNKVTEKSNASTAVVELLRQMQHHDDLITILDAG